MKKAALQAQNIAADLVLVKRFKAGDQRAFTEIYKKYENNLRFEFLKYTRNNEELTQDLVIMTFTRIYEKLNNFDSNVGAFSTWIYKLAKNMFIDHLRKDKFRDIVSIESLTTVDGEGDETEFQTVSPDLNPEERFIRKQRETLVRDSIDGLKNEMLKEVVNLRYIDDRPYEEIAETMNIPLGSVKSMISRARPMLKEFLINKGL